MTRRSSRKAFRIQISSNRPAHEVSASDFQRYASLGLIEVKSPRFGVPARGYLASVITGRIEFAPVVRIPTFCSSWYWAWFLKVAVVAAEQVAETWEQRHERIVRERQDDADLDAVIWQSSRNQKARNWFSWIPEEHKAEIIGALKPEMV